MNWNPHATATLGLEWAPNASGVYVLDANTKLAAVSFDQSVSQAIGAIGIPNVGIATRKGIYAVEAYDNETAVIANQTTMNAVPNEDVSIDRWRDQGGGSVNLWSTIDEVFPVVTADYIQVVGGPYLSPYTGRMNTGSLVLTGKRIRSVTLLTTVLLGPTAQYLLALNIGGTSYYSGAYAGPIAGAVQLSWTWRYNPATRKPWTIADVQAFDTTDSFQILGGTQPVWSTIQVYAAVMVLDVVDENRLAVGALDDSASALTPNAWNLATVTTPTGGTWTKDGAGRHLVTVRRISTGGAMSVPYLDAGVASPVATGWSPTATGVNGSVTAMGAALTRVYPVLVRTTAPADSVDSLPYASLLSALIYTGHNAEQEFSGAAATTYAVVRMLVNPGAATAALLVKIKRRSDNVQLGSTYTLTAADAKAMTDTGGGWRSVRVQLPASATLAGATQYFVELSSTAVSSAPWSTVALDTLNSGNSATYDGATDRAVVNTLEADRYDLPITVATIPVAPAGFTAALGGLDVDQSVCCTASIDRADLAWTSTGIGALFDHYLIQRSEDGGTTWADVAQVLVESVTAWHDYEARRGVAATYRIAVVRTDAAVSPWSTSATVTKPATTATMFLVSNSDPTLSVAYDYLPAKTYDFNEAKEQVIHPVYLADYQIGFNALEVRGATAHYSFLIGVDDLTPPGGGVAIRAFDPLRTLARSSLPYVCLLDGLGNRVLAFLAVPNGDESQPDARYVATVAATEVAVDPYVVPVST